MEKIIAIVEVFYNDMPLPYHASAYSTEQDCYFIFRREPNINIGDEIEIDLSNCQFIEGIGYLANSIILR